MRRFLQRVRFLQSLEQLCRWQTLLLQQAESEKAAAHRAALQSQQSYRDILKAWRKSLDFPEVDLSEDLDMMIQQVSDDVSRLEEQVC